MYTALNNATQTLTERQESYDTPDRNFMKIALLTSIKTGKVFLPTDVAVLNVSQKESREAHKPKLDNRLDDICYTAILDNLREKDIDGLYTMLTKELFEYLGIR